jgi:hypothetical protein
VYAAGALWALLVVAMLPTECRGGASAYHLLGDVAEELDARYNNPQQST